MQIDRELINQVLLNAYGVLHIQRTRVQTLAYLCEELNRHMKGEEGNLLEVEAIVRVLHDEGVIIDHNGTIQIASHLLRAIIFDELRASNLNIYWKPILDNMRNL